MRSGDIIIIMVLHQSTTRRYVAKLADRNL